MIFEAVRVGSLGMGWWSDVLADAITRSGTLQIVSCYTRSERKRLAFAAKYGCLAAPSYEAMLDDRRIEAVINTTPNNVHLDTTRAAAEAGKHVFLDKPIANTIADARALTGACRKAGVLLALGYQRRREALTGQQFIHMRELPASERRDWKADQDAHYAQAAAALEAWERARLAFEADHAAWAAAQEGNAPEPVFDTPRPPDPQRSAPPEWLDERLQQLGRWDGSIVNVSTSASSDGSAPRP